MRKTKIVCTIGPASETKEIVKGLCEAGMNVARLNFSHNTHADHQRRIDLVKEVREELHLPIAIMLDTKGPEYRIKTFEGGKILLSEGDRFTFTTDEIDIYKGISDTSYYNYAKRASKAAPYFQITEPFIAGNDFFEMVEHYLFLHTLF